jgi:hypothetical protein
MTARGSRPPPKDDEAKFDWYKTSDKAVMTLEFIRDIAKLAPVSQVANAVELVLNIIKAVKVR